MNRSVYGGAVVEFILVVPILILILGGIFHFLMGSWADIWRAHRYSLTTAPPPAVAVRVAALPLWSAPLDRKVQPLNLEENTWTRQGHVIWQETRIVHEEK